ncbi:MAG: alpha-ketoacid dehydrogenase subunit beta [Burkholderiales bacterium]|nr:alpha-ketoacid dehydrogenase subunit beta [Burkholderiales bacterium]
MSRLAYGDGIRHAFEHLLERYANVFVIGQGLWSPWYVGNSMTDLDKRFGRERVIDTPVSELACTGAAVGASLCGYRPIVVHPRVDFMLYCMDAVVNQAAKWSHMLGGQAHPAVTIRGIVNRGGEQGAQHSQALHAWFAHVPGLRVVLPYSPRDARDLLVASVLCDDPVVYVDDRWLYGLEEDAAPIAERDLREIGPRVVRDGADVTLVGASYSTHLCLQAAEMLARSGVSAEVVDLRVIAPLDPSAVVASVRKTRRLVAVDGSWSTCGLAGEVIASVVERLEPGVLAAAPARVTLPAASAPTSKPLEDAYYPTVDDVAAAALGRVGARALAARGRQR